MTNDDGTASRRHAMSPALLVAMTLAVMWTTVVWLTGGVDWRIGEIRISSRDPRRSGLAALLLAFVYAVTSARHVAGDLNWLRREGQRHFGLMAAALSLVVAIVAWMNTSVVAGGADPYGYVSQAYLWRAGRLTIDQPFVRDMPWPFAPLTFAPLGYRPSPDGGALVPTYAPGLPILMAFASAIAGDCGPFVVVPLLGGLVVWLTYALGRALGSPIAGILAALLLAVSPAFVYMLMWPMSDVPVSAFWTAALVAAHGRWRLRALASGVMMSAAILVRPNLAPVALPLVAYLVVSAPRPCRAPAIGGMGRRRSPSWRSDGGNRADAVVRCGVAFRL